MKINLHLEKDETPFNLGEELKTEIVSSLKKIRSHSNLMTEQSDFMTENQ